MSKTPLRFDLFWLGLYAILDLSWIWHDQIAYNDSGFDYRVVLRGIGCAPEQYRIAAPITASWIARHLHLHSFTAGCIVIDLLGSLLLSVLLYALVSQYLGAATLPVRNLAKLFTGLWMLFYLHWTYGSVRVETVPSCIYVVLSLLLLSRLSSARLKEAVLSIAALLALALLQGWIRADVAVVFSVGVCLASLFPIAALASTRRVMVFATGAAAAGISGGSLLYLMRVLYPNAHYCCAIYSLGHNVRFAYAYIPFLTLMPALIWGMVALAQTFRGHSITDRSILMAAPMYVAVWSFMGNWAEARIIVPFAMGLLPAVSTAMARFLMLSTASESPNQA